MNAAGRLAHAYIALDLMLAEARSGTRPRRATRLSSIASASEQTEAAFALAEELCGAGR